MLDCLHLLAMSIHLTGLIHIIISQILYAVCWDLVGEAKPTYHIYLTIACSTKILIGILMLESVHQTCAVIYREIYN